MTLPELVLFRLVGGTSLALQIGHRSSVDIDLFTDTEFDSRELQFMLSKQFATFEVIWQNRNGFSARIDGVKTDLFDWRVAFLYPPVFIDSLRLMDKLEIGAMKLEAITSRKDKKDFVDIFFLLHYFSLAELITVFRKKYPYMDYKFVLESLSAIDLADETDEPNMVLPFNWHETKKTITDNVKFYVAGLKKNVETRQEERIKKAEELLRKKKNN